MTDNVDEHFGRETSVDFAVDGLDLAVIWQRKGVLLLVAVCTVALGAVYLRNTEPVYEAEARILVMRQDVLDKDRRMRSQGQFLANQAEIIRSPVIVNTALETLSLPEFNAPEADPVADVLSGLRVSPLEDTSVLTISFSSSNPESASKVVDAIIDSYSDYVQRAEADQNADVVLLLTSREENLRNDMKRLQEKHLQLRIESPQIGDGRNAFDLPLAQLRRIGEQLADARHRKMELETRLRMAAAYGALGNGRTQADGHSSGRQNNGRPVSHATPTEDQLANTDGLAAVSYKPVDGLDMNATSGISLAVGASILASSPSHIQEQLWEAEARAANLMHIYGPRHPEVRALREQVAVWEQRLSQSQIGSSAVLETELQQVNQTERELARQYERELSGAKTLDRYLLQENQILDDMRRVEEMHKATLARLTETQLEGQALSDGHGSVQVRVIERPPVLGTKIWPRPLQFYGVCALIGLLGGSILLLFLERRPVRRLAF